MKLIFLRMGSLIASLSFGLSPGFAQQPQESRYRSSLIKLEQAGNLRSEARTLLKQKRPAEAEVKLRQAIAISFCFESSCYADLAEAQYRQGNLQEALKSMKLAFFGPIEAQEKSQMIENGAKDNLLYIVRFADIAKRCGEPDIVSPFWETAYRSILAKTSGDIAKAAQSAKSPYQIDALIYVAAGKKAESRGDHARMKELNLQALQVDPKCALAHFYAGRLSGRTREALVHFQAVNRYGSPSLRNHVKNSIETLSDYLNP